MRRGLVGVGLAMGSVSSADARSPPPPAPRPRAVFTHLAPLRNVADPVNVQHLQTLKMPTLRKCGAQEVAPGVRG